MTRYHTLDTLRGIMLISMILYHALWDLVYLFGIECSWYRSEAAYIWQQSICWIFILLSGFCWSIGDQHIKRGLQVFTAGAAVSAVTMIFMPDALILIGILTLIGSCMIITAFLDRFLMRLNRIAGLAASALLFAVTRNVNSGFLGFESLSIAELPDFLYADFFTAYFGFPPADFYSTDYFSVFPWIFLFWSGYYLHKLCLNADKMKYLVKGRIFGLTGLGKYSLQVYMAHQPVIYGTLFAIDCTGLI